jgi:Ca2+-binding EF-hand superfamily protein
VQGKAFHAATYVRPGVDEAQILEIKAAFDLFDTDQGGTIDTNCTNALTEN